MKEYDTHFRYPFKKLSLNVEQFVHNWWANQTGQYTYWTADCYEMKARMEYYIAQNLSTGPSWNIQPWMQCNYDGSKLMTRD